MNQLSVFDIDFILESLSYSKSKIRDYPIDEIGHTYQIKQKKLAELDKIVVKLRDLRHSL